MAITLDGTSGITTSSSLTTGSGAVYNGIAQSTAVASTSGTSIDFTSIPSWVKRITIMYSAVSTNGTSPAQIQIGSGSIDTTSYLGSAQNLDATALSNSNANTTGFRIAGVLSATIVWHGFSTLVNMGSNIWCFNSLVARTDTAGLEMIGSGSKTLSGALDRVRITTVNGTDTFDAGSINILYE